jgi:Ca2+-binding EF-hand superfamily protein
MLLALAPPAPAAAPPATMRAPDQLDYLFLGSDRPVHLRLHVRVGDKPYNAPWAEFMDKLFAWFDRDNDGSLSPAEVARLPMPFALTTIIQGSFGANNQTVPFAAIDTNKDGKVSKDEFRAYYRANGFSPLTFLMQNNQAEQAKQINVAILKRLGGAGDGKLTAAKVAGLYDKLRSLDENEDEIITQAELNTRGGGDGLAFAGGAIYSYATPPVVGDDSLRQLQPGQEDNLVKALVAKYDRDKDGKLTRKEIGLGEAAFARLDADGDGFLSPAELTAYVTADRPDLVLRLQLGNPTPAKGLLGRLDLGPLIPLNPRVLLVNDKTIDPALKKKYRRGPGDACAVELGDTRLSVQISPEMNGIVYRGNNKEYYLQLFTQAAGKKDHVTRADLKDPNYQILLSIYSQADKNADDKLTRAEISAWLDFVATGSDISLALTCNDLGRSLFDLLDADGDGRLSLREMRSAWARLGPLAKDGKFDLADVPRAMRLEVRLGGGRSFVFFAAPLAMAGPAPRAVNRRGTPVWFDKMDRNNDGDISPREWLGTDEEFKAIDADGDGLISADEAIRFEAKKKTKP